MSPSDKGEGAAALYDRDGAIAQITLNRPRTLNALTPELAAGLLEQIARVAADKSVRVLMLRGAGRAFMAGGDLVYLRDSNPAQAFDRSGALIAQLNSIIWALSELTIPVLAVAHGAVAGAGLSLMLACDFTIASDETRFVYAYSGIAASPDGGLSRVLAGLVGYRRAIQFAFLEPRLSASQALDWGLVNLLAPAADLDLRAREVVTRLSALPLRAFAETKRLLQAAPETGLEAQLEAERQAFQRCSQTDDLREGVQAFFGQRPARFADERL
jgi:2-(1,2-epoxy-1,2-dihydrophenyl)acetyl-CoA isomerase